MNDRVDFVCARAEHQESELYDALTMHEDLWAYCPGRARVDHDWRPTGGVSLEDAKHFLRRQPIPDVDPTVQPSD
jgi:hypothetical protein